MNRIVTIEPRCTRNFGESFHPYLAILRRCAGLREPSLVAYMIRTIFSWAGLFFNRLRVLGKMDRNGSSPWK